MCISSHIQALKPREGQSMNINLLPLSGNRLNAVEQLKIAQQLESLKVGEIIQAIVSDTLKGNKILLNINGHKMPASTEQQHSKGEQLELRVKQTGQTPQFEILKKTNVQPELISALSKSLPQQAPLTKLLSYVLSLSQGVVKSNGLKEVDYFSSIQQIGKNIPTFETLTNPAHLKHWINHSGIFLERKLVMMSKAKNNISTRNDINSDFKAQINKLANLGNEIPKALRLSPNDKYQSTLKKSNNLTQQKTITTALYKNEKDISNQMKHESIPVRGATPQPSKNVTIKAFHYDYLGEQLRGIKEELPLAINRIISNQLSSLVRLDGISHWYTDIPFTINQSVGNMNILIEEESQKQQQGTPLKVWTFRFAIELESLGGLQIKLELRNDEIFINFWSELETTETLINSGKQQLQEFLTPIGFTRCEISSHLGLKENHIVHDESHLLDTKA